MDPLPPAPIVRLEQRWREGGREFRTRTTWAACLDERCPLPPRRVPLDAGHVVGLCSHVSADL